jgi:hypothetical protein
MFRKSKTQTIRFIEKKQIERGESRQWPFRKVPGRLRVQQSEESREAALSAYVRNAILLPKGIDLKQSSCAQY